MNEPSFYFIYSDLDTKMQYQTKRYKPFYNGAYVPSHLIIQI